MQLNEGVQDSTDEKPITETFKLIFDMKKNDIPEYIPVNQYAKKIPGLRRPTKKHAQSPWKLLERFRWVKSHPQERNEFAWSDNEKETWLKGRIKKVKQREKKGKYMRWTTTKAAKNYDELIEWYNLQKLDQHLAEVNKWDSKDGREPGIETCWQRSERKRKGVRETIYGEYKYNKCRSDKLQKDALKMRNYFKTEAHLLCIADAPAKAWRAAAMSPVGSYRLRTFFGDKARFNWKNYDFHPELEKERMCYLNNKIKKIYLYNNI